MCAHVGVVRCRLVCSSERERERERREKFPGKKLRNYNTIEVIPDSAEESLLKT